MKKNLTEAEIEAIKERVEFAAKEAEEAAFTLEVWIQQYRKRSGYPGRPPGADA